PQTASSAAITRGERPNKSRRIPVIIIPTKNVSIPPIAAITQYVSTPFPYPPPMLFLSSWFYRHDRCRHLSRLSFQLFFLCFMDLCCWIDGDFSPHFKFQGPAIGYLLYFSFSAPAI